MSDNEEQENSTELGQPPVLDKLYGPGIKLVEWCPTMDLVALVGNDNVLTIQRLKTKQTPWSWQKLAQIANVNAGTQSSETEITAIAWRPDGKYIAVGHHEGLVVIVDIETGNTIHSSSEDYVPTHTHKIRYLQWIQDNGVVCPTDIQFNDRTKVFLPYVPEDKKANISYISNERPTELTILVIVDESGKISYRAHGTFGVGVIEPNKLSSGSSIKDMKIHSSFLRSDLKSSHFLIYQPIPDLDDDQDMLMMEMVTNPNAYQVPICS
eukprot:TRINITY_DN1211_c0_g1_i2.p1 TRINITY_DN1211_c0_g1~~TRINITY_DN1211_c0_g1_i2.p1  ORF type:complete len:267 (+),score=54.02 TRINITY_DN1211_c0_g1_i2:248-1048(+)